MMKKTEHEEKRCEFCRFSTAIAETEQVLCEYRGVVAREYACRRFLYEPLKRVPRRLPELIVPDDLAE